MKTTIFYLLLICFFTCSCSSRFVKTNTERETSNSSDIDSLITETKSGVYGIDYRTGSYIRDEAIFYEKANRGEITIAMEYKIELSPQTLEMIERDGGMLNVLKNCLTSENFNKLDRLTFITVNVTMSLDGSIVTGHSFVISNKNMSNIQLSPQEIDRLFNYFKQITIVYTGSKFRDEIVPVGWSFPGIVKKE